MSHIQSILLTKHFFRTLAATITFVIAVSVAAFAKADTRWVPIVESASGSTRFADLSSLWSDHRFVYVSTLDDYSVRQDTGELSAVSDDIVSCSNRMIKTTRLRTYNRRQAVGRLLSDDDLVEYQLDTWRAPAPNSLEYVFLVRVCSLLGR